MAAAFSRQKCNRFSAALPLRFRHDSNGVHGQHGDHPSAVGLDDRLHEQVLPDQPAVPQHVERQRSLRPGRQTFRKDYSRARSSVRL